MNLTVLDVVVSTLSAILWGGWFLIPIICLCVLAACKLHNLFSVPAPHRGATHRAVEDVKATSAADEKAEPREAIAPLKSERFATAAVTPGIGRVAAIGLFLYVTSATGWVLRAIYLTNLQMTYRSLGGVVVISASVAIALVIVTVQVAFLKWVLRTIWRRAVVVWVLALGIFPILIVAIVGILLSLIQIVVHVMRN